MAAQEVKGISNMLKAEVVEELTKYGVRVGSITLVELKEVLKVERATRGVAVPKIKKKTTKTSAQMHTEELRVLCLEKGLDVDPKTTKGTMLLMLREVMGKDNLMGFGKHSQLTWGEVPQDYAEWALEAYNMNSCLQMKEFCTWYLEQKLAENTLKKMKQVSPQAYHETDETQMPPPPMMAGSSTTLRPTSRIPNPKPPPPTRMDYEELTELRRLAKLEQMGFQDVYATAGVQPDTLAGFASGARPGTSASAPASKRHATVHLENEEISDMETEISEEDKKQMANLQAQMAILQRKNLKAFSKQNPKYAKEMNSSISAMMMSSLNARNTGYATDSSSNPTADFEHVNSGEGETPSASTGRSSMQRRS